MKKTKYDTSKGQAEGKISKITAPKQMAVKLLKKPLRLTLKRMKELEEMIKEDFERVSEKKSEKPTKVQTASKETITIANKQIKLLPLGLKQQKGKVKVAAKIVNEKALLFFQGRDIFPKGSNGGSAVNEPSVAQAGKNVFYVGNWYAAHSSDGGLNWSYINPWADMQDFCCDQDVIYDRGRDLFIWYRQGTFDASGKNRFLLSISTDGGISWFSYSISPSTLNNQWTKNQAFDFPKLALSNNFLYLHTGMRGDNTPDAVVLRLPLNELSRGLGLSFWWWGQLSYWAGPVQGATTTMYFGDHIKRSNKFRIYAQSETNSGITWKDITIPSWQLEEGGNCPSKDGQNWCSRSDSVVRAGWVSKGIIGFMWQAKEGGTFPFPYVEAATFSETDNFKYLSRPLIWSKQGAWHYPFASPNARGDIAVTAYFSSANSFPSPYFLIWDDFNQTPPPPWENYLLFSSTMGAPAWGDYVRNRAFNPSQLGWVTSACTVQQNSLGAEPLFYILCRERDRQSIERFWQT
jgi:hypothetical protein